ncbi:hypothetical protein BOX15_Mlig006494g2 [Macrostomum lignano]|uniref:Uncharacterized protein n=1 Tax=Macrostomum lignano TaxID=282301 RepID=A0A267FMM7_9PLAT|nr:hypothetical protein BOX15_Mlig006494g1 [Macrostomum lignano]PAA74367.1 hypothetical protein BOX15_Mlig006494g2 [Macrostomum lignano]
MQQQQQQRGSRGRRKTARPFAEIRVRDKNMKMQLQLGSECAKFNRDWSAWTRDNEKTERDLLVDLAHMMDTKLTPSVDDWFNKRRIRQASCLPDLPPRRRRIRNGGDAPGGEDEAGVEDDEDDGDSAMRLLDRQRILEAKRTDWIGATSVPARLLPRPATAAAAARVAAATAANAAEDSLLAAAAAAGGGSSGGSGGGDASLTSAAAAASAPGLVGTGGGRPKTAAAMAGLRKTAA